MKTEIVKPAPAQKNIPMIQTGQALLSLRDSGHSLSTALGEVVDNSIEANANNIHVVLEQSASTVSLFAMTEQECLLTSCITTWYSATRRVTCEVTQSASTVWVQNSQR